MLGNTPQNPKLIYAGIGARKTPFPVQHQMAQIAEQLSPTGWLLRSGHALGADLAFESKARQKEIHLPWAGYNNAPTNDPNYLVPTITAEMVDIAARHHPVWERLTDSAKMMMCRNVSIVLGQKLDNPAKLVICWTPNGELVGGTAHGMKVAKTYDIPVFNIAKPEDQVNLCKFTLQI